MTYSAFCYKKREARASLFSYAIHFSLFTVLAKITAYITIAQNALTPYAKNKVLTAPPSKGHITVTHKVRMPKPQIKPTTIVQLGLWSARRLKDNTSIKLVIK